MADDKTVFIIIGVIAVLGIGLYYGGVFDFLGSIHPGQWPVYSYPDTFICATTGGGNIPPMCVGNICFGRDDGGRVWINSNGVVTKGDAGVGQAFTVNPSWRFDGKCMVATPGINTNIVYNGYFIEKGTNTVTVEQTSNFNTAAQFQTYAWITYTDPSSGSLVTYPAVASNSGCVQDCARLSSPPKNCEANCGSWSPWSWSYTMVPGTKQSHSIELPSSFNSGLYTLQVTTALVGSPVYNFNSIPELAAEIQIPNENNPASSVWGQSGQDVGYWSRPLSISTQPIYDGECPCSNSDYSCQSSSNLCVRKDILNNNLACQTVGCPVNTDKTYLCASNGICAENVAQFKGCTKDSDCSSELTCDIPSGTCVRVEKVECSSSSGCIIPCSAVSVSCSNSKCVYSGSCSDSPTGFNDCNSGGCDSGYVCNKETGVCYTNILPSNPTSTTYPPTQVTKTPAVTPTVTTSTSFFSSVYFYILLGVIALIVIFIFLNKKGS